MIDSTDQYLDGNMVGSIDAPAAPKTLESTIAERITTNVFPVVYPTEQNSENEKQAIQTLSLVDKMESVALQSYIDEQWRIYREDLPVDDSIPEAVRRARWSREYYYVHMRQFIEEKQHVDSTDKCSFSKLNDMVGSANQCLYGTMVRSEAVPGACCDCRIGFRIRQDSMTKSLSSIAFSHFLNHSRRFDFVWPSKHVMYQAVCRAAVSVTCPRCIAKSWLEKEEGRRTTTECIHALWHEFVCSRILRRFLKRLCHDNSFEVVIAGSWALRAFQIQNYCWNGWHSNDIDIFIKADDVRGSNVIDEIEDRYCREVTIPLNLDWSSETHLRILR